MSDYMYEKDLEIDQDSLDREFIRQANLYMKYAELFAQADREAKEAKEEMEHVHAMAFTEVVSSYDKKPSDSFCDAIIAKRKDYREAQRNYIDKRYEADLLASAVKAFEHKKSALENLARLWVGGYYSTPRQTKDSEEVKHETRSNRQRRKLNADE